MLIEHFTNLNLFLLDNYWIRGILYLGFTALCMFEAATMSSGLSVTYLRAAMNGESGVKGDVKKGAGKKGRGGGGDVKAPTR
ncbi:hypothetical protein HDU67_008551 [Dinochytrium kinnereticum]|nr:hypothetical protein HDU67_008551 [Dinochytrium kinnereticum]